MFKYFVLILIVLISLTGCSNNSNTTNENTSNNQAQPSKTSAIVNETNSSSTESINTVAPSPVPTPEVELASYTTDIYTHEDGRNNNISITCSKINGQTVANGDTFSFEDIVGKATTAKGYQEADIFDSEGNVKQGLGGGNCQVSSTLYNAVLAVSGLTVVERHEHSRDVVYVPDDKDAAVAYGNLDFRFKNETGSTVKIYTSSTPEQVTVRLVKI